MSANPTEHQPNPALHGEEHVVVFRLGDESYALDIQCVQEIVRMQTITRVPGAEAWVEGITNLRGRVVPVIDLRRRCHIVPCAYTAETRIVVVSSPGGMVGLTVDAVSEVIRIPVGQIEAPGEIAGLPQHAYLRGIAKLEDRLISLLDLEGILPDAAESPEEQPGVAAA
ncbi:MAG: chemotaxis protein CheW [Tepidiformaceae bacterium]